jgi:hypothetical protein
MNNLIKKMVLILLLLIAFQMIVQPVLADEQIIMDFFYSGACGSCREKFPVIQEIEQNETYNDRVIINWKDHANNQTAKQEWEDVYVPKIGRVIIFVVIKSETNETILLRDDITEDEIKRNLDLYLAGEDPDSITDENIVEIPFFGKVNLSALSLPVLTVILGGLDSINPCSIFILFILLSLLLHVQSRRRMLLIGGIFIFFSFFWYILFMFILLLTFSSFQAGLIAIVAGSIALIWGVLNIKDFFFFKKGASLSIPDDKKRVFYRQMRKIISASNLTKVIIATIVLAVTVNFFELICSLEWPVIFTTELRLQNLPALQSSLYILAYNVIYVIPLIIIVLLFAYTLGRRTLTEWHGRILKLLSGIMLSSFGILFIVDYKILENVVTPILLLGVSLIATSIIAFLWNKYEEKKGHSL